MKDYIDIGWLAHQKHLNNTTLMEQPLIIRQSQLDDKSNHLEEGQVNRGKDVLSVGTPEHHLSSPRKMLSQKTSATLHEDSPSSHKQNSPTASAFDNYGSAFDSVEMRGGQIEKSSFQNQLREKGTLVSRMQNTQTSTSIHNQYYMQNQPHQLVSLHQQSHKLSPVGAKHKKETPNTEHSSSPEQKREGKQCQFLTMAPQLASNCEFKHQKKNQHFPPKTTTHPSQQKKMPTKPKREVYYKNRARLMDWLRNQCVKLQLSHQSYASALFMMDHYWKREDFNSNEFLQLALCMMVISSKLNQTKVLYTGRMGVNNGIEEGRMMEREMELIVWFRFRPDAWNFARVVGEYLRRWDQIVGKRDPSVMKFVGDTVDNFIATQKIFYLCERQLKQNRELTTDTIKIIFQEFLLSETFCSFSANELIDEIFKEENIFAREEMAYVFEYLENNVEEHDEYAKLLIKQVNLWLKEFKQQKEEFLRKKYKELTMKNIPINTILTREL